MFLPSHDPFCVIFHKEHSKNIFTNHIVLFILYISENENLREREEADALKCICEMGHEKCISKME